MRPPRRTVSGWLGMPSAWPAIVALFFATPLFAASTNAKHPSSAAPTPIDGIAAARANPGTLAQEKQRVPRNQPKTKSKPKPDSPDSESDSGCGSNCAESCFSGGVEPSTPPPPSPAVAPVPPGWKVYDHGWYAPEAPGDSMLLFEGPVEAGRPDVPVGVLHDGDEVVVMEIHTLPDGVELRVRAVDRVEALGWVAGGAISPVPPGARTPSKPVPSQPSGWGPVAPTPWGVQLMVGGGGVLNEDLADEYADGGFHAEAYYLNFGRGLPSDASFYWGAGVGFSDMRGNPKVDYVSATEIDQPFDSNLRLFDVAAEGGFLFCSRIGLRGRVSLGPALFFVHESAEVRTYDPSMTTLLGTRHEALDRPAGGGTMRLALGWRLRSRIELGMQIDGYLMAWNGQQKESLTTDYTKNAIGGMDIGLSITFPEP